MGTGKVTPDKVAPKEPTMETILMIREIAGNSENRNNPNACVATPNAAGTANALIYGHNTASGSMFSQLLNYADKAFYTAHPTFQFDTLYEEGTWQVAAVLRTELGADALPYYSFFDASTQEEWQQRVDAILELSLYDTGVVPQYGDQLLTLSTCGVATVTTNSRFAVLAVKIN